MGRASRRRWPGLVLLFALVTGPLGWGLLIEPNRLIVRTETVALPRFPRLRIAMVADLHAGAPFVGEAKIREVVEELNRSQADLILLLGDYVIGHHAGDGVLGGTKMAPEQVAKALTGLRARLGVYAVLGNHDVWTHAPAMKRAFEGASIRVLDDEALFVPGASLWLVGFADFMSARPDPTNVVGAIPHGHPILAFTHSPDVFPSVPERVPLTLAGHTHGGQVRLPFIGAPVVPSKYGSRYVARWTNESGHLLYVTTGLGTSILPIRFGVPPEIVILDVNRS